MLPSLGKTEASTPIRHTGFLTIAMKCGLLLQPIVWCLSTRNKILLFDAAGGGLLVTCFLKKSYPPYSLAAAPSTFVYFRGEASQFTPRHCLPSPHYFSTTLVGLHPFPLPEGSRSREGSTAYKIICFSVLYKGVGVCWLAVPLITSASFQCCCKLLGQIPLAGVGFPHLAKNGFNLPFSAVLVSLT